MGLPCTQIGMVRMLMNCSTGWSRQTFYFNFFKKVAKYEWFTLPIIYVIHTSFTYTIYTYRDSYPWLTALLCLHHHQTSQYHYLFIAVFYSYSYLVNKSIELITLPVIFFRLEGHVTRRNFWIPLWNKGKQPRTFYSDVSPE